MIKAITLANKMRWNFAKKIKQMLCKHTYSMILHKNYRESEGFYGEHIKEEIRHHECRDCGAHFKTRRYLP